MTLGTILTFIGLLLTSYSVFRSDRRAVIHTFLPVGALAGAVGGSILALLTPMVLAAQGNPVSGWERFFAEGSAFVLLIGALVFAGYRIWRAELRGRAVARFGEVLPSATAEADWAGLRYVLRRNRAHLLDVLPAEDLRQVFDPRLVSALIDLGDWTHLEILSDEVVYETPNGWRFAAADVLGRALLEGHGTLLQKVCASRFSSHEFLKPTAAEAALFARTYAKPAWYSGLRADYPLVGSGMERLESGALDRRYNRANRHYSLDQGVSERWNCPIWVGVKTMGLAIAGAIEARDDRDMHVSDLFNILDTVLDRSKYEEATWHHKGANPEYPTPYAFLISEICHDLRDLTRAALRKAMVEPGGVASPGAAPQLSGLTLSWALGLGRLAHERTATDELFRRRLLRDYLDLYLQLEHSRDDLFPHSSVNVSEASVAEYRALLWEELRRAFLWSQDAKAELVAAGDSLDSGRHWVVQGRSTLCRQLAEI